MKLKAGTEEQYATYKSNNTDPYGARVVSYGEDWADLMEGRMSKGEALEDIAEATSRQADTDGITGFMYGAAVSALAHCWEHGERLRVWHNRKTQIGTEGERANESGGVLNPALFCVSDAP